MKKLNNRGFAVSSVLYPILILTIFLIVQVLTMMASRKTVLDKNKQQLLDSVNASNKIYTTEELSILVGDLQKSVDTLKTENTNLKNQIGTQFKFIETLHLSNETKTLTLQNSSTFLISSIGGAWSQVGGLWFASTGNGSNSTIKLTTLSAPEHCSLTTSGMNLQMYCDTWSGNFTIYKIG